MRETKLNWSDLRLFLAVARGGGLAGGAKLSGQSAPTLGRHMTELEHTLGEILFQRLPQGYELTDAGQDLFAQAEAVEERILDIERARHRNVSSFPVRVSAGTWMTWFLTRNIDRLNVSNTNLVFSTTEQRDDIGHRHAIIGLRNQRPTERGLAARRTTHVTFAPYATETAANGTSWIGSTGSTPSATWVKSHMREHICIEVTSPRSLLDLALASAGHVVLPCFVGDAFQELVRSGPRIDELSHEQWLVVHGEERNRPAVRRIVDAIANLIVNSRKQFDGV